MTSDTLPRTFGDFDGNIIVSINPNSTGIADDSASRRETAYFDREIRSLFIGEHQERVELVPPNADAEKRREKLRKYIQPGSLIVVFGGDGSVVEVADFLRTDEHLSEDLRSTAILHAPFGNANNTASELTPYTSGYKPSILDIINHGEVIDGYGTTLKISSDHPEAEGLDVFSRELTAVSCHSVQVGGYVGNALNEVRGKSLRKSENLRFLVDGRASEKAIRNTPQIEMQINGETVNAIGSVGVSSARYLRSLRTPASIAEQAFYDATMIEGRRRYLAKTVMQHLRGRLEWNKVEAGQSTIYDLLAQPGQQLMLETDAEPHLLYSHPDREVQIRVVASPQEKPFRVFTTNPELIYRAA